MARQLFFFCIVMSSLLCRQSLFSQSLDLTQARIEAGVDAAVLPRIYQTTDQAYQEYARLASLRDESTGKVSGQSVKAFKALFAFNAKVFDDMATEPAIVNYADYVSRIFNMAGDVGAVHQLDRARVLSVSFDAGGYYHIKIGVDKTLKQALDNRNRLISYPAPGRCFSLVLEYDIAQAQPDKAELINIRGAPCAGKSISPTDTGSPWSVGALARFGTLWYSLKRSDRVRDMEINPDGARYAAFGGELRYSMGVTRSIQVGLRLHLASYRTGIGGGGCYGLDNMGNVIPCDSITTIKLSNWKESAILSGLESTLTVYARLWQNGAFSVQGKAGFGMLIRPVAQKEFRYGEQTYNNVSSATDKNLELENPEVNPLIASLHLGADVQYAIDERLSVELGFDGSLGLVSAYRQQKEPVFFLDRSNGINDKKNTFFDTYLKEMRLNRWGIQIGLIYKI